MVYIIFREDYMQSKVTAKGQIVIPSKLRQKYNIKNGTRIQFYEKNGEICLLPVTPEIIDKNFGFIGTRGILLKALMKEKDIERNI
jgi:AbrB family looped-hinge helix DNA binding protein